MAKNYRIVQLSPATDFLALYRTTAAPYYELRHVMALALLEAEGGARWVSGLDEKMHLCSETPDFQEYVHASSVNPGQRDVWREGFKK